LKQPEVIGEAVQLKWVLHLSCILLLLAYLYAKYCWLHCIFMYCTVCFAV